MVVLGFWKFLIHKSIMVHVITDRISPGYELTLSNDAPVSLCHRITLVSFFLETLVACLPVGLFNPNDRKRTLFDLEYYTMNDDVS